MEQDTEMKLGPRTLFMGFFAIFHRGPFKKSGRIIKIAGSQRGEENTSQPTRSQDVVVRSLGRQL